MLWPTLFIVALVGFIASAVLAGYLYASRRSLAADRDRLEREAGEHQRAKEAYLDELDKARRARDEKQDELNDAHRALATLQEREANFEKRVEEVKQAQEQAEAKAKEAFKALSNDALERAEKRFLDMARRSFEGEQKDAAAELEKRKQAITEMLRPIRESLDKQARAVSDIESKREGAYHALKQQITSMLEAQQQLGRQTHTLANALKGSTTSRGRWGEITLKRVAEMAGMAEHCDFEEQVTIWRGDSQQRPDMVVHMPSDRLIIVDSKSVGGSYLEAVEAADEAAAAALLDQHVRDIESRVRDLSLKAYHDQLEHSPDFVVLFLPGDSFLHPAVHRKPDLIEKALSNKVVIATPTTLISLLKVIELGWREEKLAENAARVRDLGIQLHGRIETMVGHLVKLGKSIGQSVDHFNKLTGSVERSVLPAARRFEELGAQSDKKLPAEGGVSPVESTPRQLTVETGDGAAPG